MGPLKYRDSKLVTDFDKKVTLDRIFAFFSKSRVRDATYARTSQSAEGAREAEGPCTPTYPDCITAQT